MPRRHALLITRPEPQASRLAAALKAEWGDRLEISISPLMQTDYLTPALPEGPYATLLLSSEAGAEAAVRLCGSGVALPRDCACVGYRTAAAAVGFNVTDVAPSVAELLSGLRRHPKGPYLYLHGKDVTLPLAQMLTEAGQTASAVMAYTQNQAPLTDDALAFLTAHSAVIVPLFSARSAKLFLDAVPSNAIEKVQPCVISAMVVHALPPALAKKAVIAKTPDGPGMQAAIRRAMEGLSP